MRISALHRRRYRAALRSPLITSSGVVRERVGVLVTLRSDDGLVGGGEASPAIWVGGESIDAVERALDSAATRIELEGARLDDALASLRAVSPAAAFALDTAWCELTAKSDGVSVCELLGGGRPQPQAVAVLLEAASPSEITRRIEILRNQGFKTFKLKLGMSRLRDDVARVAAARSAAPDAAVRLDANRAWDEPTAYRALEALGRYGPDYIEEPLALAQPAALRRLSERGLVPIALDESIGDRHDLQRHLGEGSVSVIVVKAARLGGLRVARDLALCALDGGLRVVVTDSLETRVGQLAALHLAASLPAPRAATGLAGAWLLAEASMLIDGREQPAPEHAFTGTGLGLDADPRHA